MSVDGKRKLVVSVGNDNMDQRLVVLLEKEGYRVFKAVTASQTARWAEAEEPAMILIPLCQSRFFPLEVIGAVKECSRTRGIPIGLVGDYGALEEDIITCLDIGADFYLGSPGNESFFLASLRSAIRMQSQMDELKRLSITDELTGLYNRRFFLRRMEEEIARAERYGISLVCIMIDLDNFKDINDTQGHQVGDRVLVEVGEILAQNIRKSDILARYGGDEFTILLFHNSIRGATILAEYLRKAVESHPFLDGTLSAQLTISLGLSPYSDDGMSQSAHDLIKHADLALYDAKSRGKNQFTIFGKSSYSQAAGEYHGEPG